MSGQWQLGDLALCINARGWLNSARGDVSPGPGGGSIHTVEGLGQSRTGLILRFEPWPDRWYIAKCFRRIPPCEADDFDNEIIAAMKKRVDSMDG